LLETIRRLLQSLYDVEGLIRWGGPLLVGEDSFFFRRSPLRRAHDFYEKYGGKTVILARFVPIIRTFCPPVAGAARMTYSRYLLYDVFGGTFWVGSMILGGYFLGRSIPNISRRIHYVIAVVVFLSILPAIVGVLRARGHAAGAAPPPSPASETHGK